MTSPASIALLVHLSLLVAVSGFSATIHVPGDQPTIQTGIDAASPGDLVLVAPGTYIGPGNKNLDFRGKDIEVRSESGAETTIIDCEGSGRGFQLVAPITSAARVDGFTIQNGDVASGEGGGGMVIIAASPTIENCIFRDNRAFGSILLGGGGALACYLSSSAISSCFFADNTAYGITPGGGAIRGMSSPLVITDCQFLRNIAVDAGGSGGGIELDHGTVADVIGRRDEPVRVARCRFIDNLADVGGGIHPLYPLTIEDCTFAGNSAREGGAVYCFGIGGSTTVTRSTIVRNSSPQGGTVTLYGLGTRIENSIIAFNTGPALEVNYDCSGVDIRCTDIFANSLGDWVGCLGTFLGEEGNISEDPLLCDAPGRDFRLADGSPCAPEHSGSCGLIGAWPVGCGATVVDPTTWGAVKHAFSR